MFEVFVCLVFCMRFIMLLNEIFSLFERCEELMDFIDDFFFFLFNIFRKDDDDEETRV